MSELAGFVAIVHGRVQGVSFRRFVRIRAMRLSLTGYAKNLPGGWQLEIRAEGEMEGLRELLSFLKVGPPGAVVEKVEVDWADFTGTFPSFEILY